MRELRNCNEIVKMDSRTVEGYALVFSKHSISDFSKIPSKAVGSITSVKPPKSLDCFR